jgi:uncharacterized protein
VDVAILGASDKTDRYAYLAFAQLRKQGHQVFPVNPHLDRIDGIKVVHSLKELPQPIHTVTVYVNKRHSDMVLEELVALGPQRLIINPGAENEALGAAARAAGIEVIQDCTLMMLRSGRF